VTLRHRVERLERRHQVSQRISDVHVHYGERDPRESCEKCKAMTEKEYRAWLAKDDGGHIKVIEICRSPAADSIGG